VKALKALSVADGEMKTTDGVYPGKNEPNQPEPQISKESINEPKRGHCRWHGGITAAVAVAPTADAQASEGATRI